MACCLWAAGCAGQPYRTAERLQRGLVVVLPGIEGRSAFNEAICRGLDKGGVNCAIELYDWTSSLGPFYNLRAQGRNRRVAWNIVWRVRQYQWDHPGRPVVLVGQSGGGAMAVWVGEQMLEGDKVDGIILLAASLSPEYILDFALENSRQGIVNFHSSRDWVFLGVGTTVYGTMDGRHTASAGSVGFSVPKSELSMRSYDRLFQIRWRPGMAETGYAGTHLTSGAEEFVSAYVAPFVRAILTVEAWDKQLVETVAGGNGLEPTAPATMPAEASERPGQADAEEHGPSTRPAEGRQPTDEAKSGGGSSTRPADGGDPNQGP